MHWKAMMDRNYVSWYDLPQGRDAVVTIDRVVAGTLQNSGKTTKKPLAYFVGKVKPLALNSTNCRTIEQLYGWDVSAWAGKRISLYVGTTNDPSNHGSQINCVRVRPVKPSAKASDESTPLDTRDPEEASNAD